MFVVMLSVVQQKNVSTKKAAFHHPTDPEQPLCRDTYVSTDSVLVVPPCRHWFLQENHSASAQPLKCFTGTATAVRIPVRIRVAQNVHARYGVCHN